MLIDFFGGAPIYPIIVHITPERIGIQASATVIGLEIASTYIGSTLFPLATGLIAGNFGMFLFL